MENPKGQVPGMHVATVREIARGYPSRFSFLGGSLDATKDRVSAGDDFLAPFASVTKLVTALATMIAATEEIVCLDDRIEESEITIADLLAHASGLGPDGTVDGFLEHRLVAPRQRRIYSNLGYELVAKILEGAAEMPFSEYVAEAVLRPLGMTTCYYDERLFVNSGRGGATGLMGTIADLAGLVTAMAGPGFLPDEIYYRFCRPYCDGLAGVLPGYGAMPNNAWGLGPEVRDGKSPHWSSIENSPETFGHFGRSGSIVWIDPIRSVFLVSLSEEPFGGWALPLWPQLATALLS